MSPGAPAPKAERLTQPKYASFRHASHCLHLDEALGAISHRRLTPVRATDSLANIRSKILWCTLGFSNGHSMYGNVSFVADWGTVLNKLGSNLYMIDQTISADSSCTRVLLTRSSYEGVLQKVDNIDGSPIIEKMGHPFHVVRCQNKKECDGPHEVKLAVEADEGEARWLFTISHVLVNDHFFVNLPIGKIDKQCKSKDGRTQRYKHHKCFKYNSHLNGLCPFQLRREDVECKLKKECREVVLRNISDLIFTEEEKLSHVKLKPSVVELSKNEEEQKNPGVFQHYNCLEDTKKVSVKGKRFSEPNMTELCSLEDSHPIAIATVSTDAGTQNILSCGQYHRYRPTKEDDAFRQIFEPPVGDFLTDTATGGASEVMSNVTEPGQMLPCKDLSAQICMAEGQSVSADKDLVCSRITSEHNRPVVRSSYGKEIDNFQSIPDKVIEPKLEIDLMKIALDNVKHKLLNLEKAISKQNQSSLNENIKTSGRNSLHHLSKLENHDKTSEQVGVKRLSEQNQKPQQNTSINNVQLEPNPISEKINPEGNPNFNCTNTSRDAVDAIEPPGRRKYRELSSTLPSKVPLSSGVNSGGRNEDPSKPLQAAGRMEQRKRSSTLFSSTLSSAVKARAKRVVGPQ